jgi:hypothetical protein
MIGLVIKKPVQSFIGFSMVHLGRLRFSTVILRLS